MSVKIRLARMGAKKKPFYRVVAADSRAPRDGKFIEVLGTFSPLAESSKISIDKEKVEKWLRNGAQPTETARALLVKEGILKPLKKDKYPEYKKEDKAEEIKKGTESQVSDKNEDVKKEAVKEDAKPEETKKETTNPEEVKEADSKPEEVKEEDQDKSKASENVESNEKSSDDKK